MMEPEGRRYSFLQLFDPDKEFDPFPFLNLLVPAAVSRSFSGLNLTINLPPGRRHDPPNPLQIFSSPSVLFVPPLLPPPCLCPLNVFPFGIIYPDVPSLNVLYLSPSFANSLVSLFPFPPPCSPPFFLVASLVGFSSVHFRGHEGPRVTNF